MSDVGKVTNDVINIIGQIEQITSGTSTHDKISLFNNFVYTLKSPAFSYDLNILPVEERFVKALRLFCADPSRSVCAGVYRVFRYASRPSCPLMLRLTQCGVSHMLLRALEREKNTDLERVEAIKLVRVVIDHAPQHVPVLLVTSFSTLAVTRSSDSMRTLFLDELNKLLLANPDAISRGGGLRALLAPAVEPSASLSGTFVQVIRTLMTLATSPATRVYLRPDTTVQLLLAPLTDDLRPTASKHAEDAKKAAQLQKQRLQVAKLSLTTMCRCWAGLAMLGTTITGLSAVIHSLRCCTVPDVREAIFAALFDIFSFPPDERAVLTTIVEAPHRPTPHELPAPRVPEGPAAGFTVYMLYAFKHAGLIDALVQLASGVGRGTAPATVLLSHIAFLVDVLVPVSERDKFSPVGGLTDGTARAAALLARLNALSATRRTEGVPASRLDVIRRQMHLTVPRADFLEALKTTLVTTHRPAQWQWAIITELVVCQISAQQPVKLQDAIADGWIKKLLVFYDFTKGGFPAHPVDSAGREMATVGIMVIGHLLATPDGSGARHLTGPCGGLLTSISSVLAAALASPDDPDIVLSVHRTRHTLAGQVFRFVATIARAAPALLQEARIMPQLYQLATDSPREDLIQAMVTALDYSTEGHTRVLLAAVMTNHAVQSARHAATLHLGEIVAAAAAPAEWAIDLLVTQLFDPSVEVVGAAFTALEAACDVPANLEMLVAKRPNLLGVYQQSGRGGGLVIKFLTVPAGLAYLTDIGWLDAELLQWSRVGVHSYPDSVRRALTSTLSDGIARPLPQHLYGELCRTGEGTALLKDRGVVDAHIAMLHTADGAPLQTAVWVVAHVASTDVSFAAFLGDGDTTVGRLVELAETADDLDVRGSVFLALGLLCSPLGAAALARHGWAVHPSMKTAAPHDPAQVMRLKAYTFAGSPLGPDFGIAAPSTPRITTADGRVAAFTSLDRYLAACPHPDRVGDATVMMGEAPDPMPISDGWSEVPAPDAAILVNHPTPPALPTPTDDPGEAVLAAIRLAQNPVTQDAALQRIRTIRARQPDAFKSGRTLVLTADQFGRHRCRDSVRRTCLSLFDHVPAAAVFEAFDQLRDEGALMLE